jgi:hypothetical protein
VPLEYRTEVRGGGEAASPADVLQGPIRLPKQLAGPFDTHAFNLLVYAAPQFRSEMTLQQAPRLADGRHHILNAENVAGMHSNEGQCHSNDWILYGQDIRRPTHTDVRGPYDNLLVYHGFARHELVQKFRGLVACSFDTQCDTRHRRRCQFAYPRVIIHAYDCRIMGYSQSREFAGRNYMLAVVIIAGHYPDGLG